MLEKTSLSIILLLGIATLFLFNLRPQQKPELQYINQFQSFKKDFSKIYINSAEQIFRKAIFIKNWLKIQKHNLDASNSHKLRITLFADLSDQQFNDLILGTKIQIKQITLETKNIKKLLQPIRRVQQSQIDWSAIGKVTSVKNQGICGSCWAFSASGAIQSSYAIYKNYLMNLSPQQLIDCSDTYGNHGCNGGSMDNAFRYVKDNGIVLQTKYPYVGRTQQCQIQKGDFKIQGFTDIYDCNSLYNAIQHRPVSVAVDASTWALYSSGILRICGNNVNHGVLLVGVNEKFWKIKNSWGVNWGQNGYIRIARGNTCGVCISSSYPTL